MASRDSSAGRQTAKGAELREAVPLSPDERKLLLDQPSRRYPTGIRNRAMIGVMLLCGLRCFELLGLKPREVDLKEGIIYVRGKGKKRRELDIPGSLEGPLRDWLRVRPPGPTFFVTLQGKTIHDSYVRRMVKRYAEKAGIEADVYPHLLRHTFATSCLNEDPKLTVREVQKLMGHSRLDTTEGYLHTTEAETRAKMRAR